MQRTVRVLRVVTLGSKIGAYGGPWSTACRQAETLHKAGFEVKLSFGYMKADMPTAPVSTCAGTVRKYVPVGRFSGLFSSRLAIRQLVEIYRSDIVHVSIARDLLPVWSAVVAALLGRRLILQPHGMLSGPGGRFASLVDPFIRLAFARATDVICLTDQEAADLKSWLGGALGRVVVLGNAVPDRLLAPGAREPESTPEVLFMARLHQRKRPDLFVRAEAVARAAGVRAAWTIVGPDDGLEGAIRQLNDELGGHVNIELPVAPESVHGRLAAASVFVLCSEAEPWGNILAGALTMGIPVVVTESSALAAEILANDAGLVIRDGSASEIAEAVGTLLTDSEIYERVSLNAIAFASRRLTDSALSGVLLATYQRSNTCEH